MSRGDANILRSAITFASILVALTLLRPSESIADSPETQPTSQPSSQPASIGGSDVAHWSGMPIWGDKVAREHGYELPLPLAVSGSMFSETANFNVPSVSIGRGAGMLNIDPLVRVSNVRISETAWTVRPDCWVLPFLNLYAIGGNVGGDGKVTVRPAAIPGLRSRGPKYDLKLDYDGPTVGFGGTLAAGFKPFEDRSTIVFGLADLNFTRTYLDFKNVVSSLPGVDVMVFSPRLGVRERIIEKSPLGEVHLALWGGCMYQHVQEVMAGRVADLLDFRVNVEAVNPWNTLVGGRIEIGRNTVLTVEGGFGDRKSLMVELAIRF